MPDTGPNAESNVYQLAFIGLGFQMVGLFLNVIVILFRDMLTGVFTGIFSLFKGP